MMDGTVPPDHDGSIAIIGLSGRFPGARDVNELWRNVVDGVESVSFFSDAELEAEGIPKAVRSAPGYVPAGAVLDGIELFDAAFFGYSPREAELMDPQHRLFLEHAWDALESTGYLSENHRAAVGVFAGASPSSYLSHHIARNGGADGDIRTVVGNNVDFLCTRVSYKLGLQGPSVVVQTSCSTSLVAVHLACQSLLGYESDLALAGGVSVNLPHRAGYLYLDEGIYSPDGHCRPFDARAAGTVGGNGVGVVVLKRLADALEDGDRIRAVILGSAINNDGSDKIGFTAPSVRAQAEVIAAAQAMAGVSPDTVGYVESHGTGTKLGDPIELAALTEAFRAGTERNGFCAIGSLKANIGHLDAAAGVAGLIKATLALEQRTLPPSVNFETPNPELDLENSPFHVSTEARPWAADSAPRRAGVSSFGMGGTNAHVVLEEAPVPAAASRASSRPRQLLVLSARTAKALEAATDDLADHLERHPGDDLADVAFTLQVGRRAHPHRRAIVCEGRDDAIESLRSRAPRRVRTAESPRAPAPVAFLFPGQGAQHAGMARGLYEEEAGFREPFDRCAERLLARMGRDLREIVYGAEGAAGDAELEQTAITQPSLFSVEYALARLWMSWGIHPRAMLGHSIGEYVAACLAGVFSLEDALALVAARGELMQGMPPGSMLAVGASEDEIRERLGAPLSIAALNAPGSAVVSGPSLDIEALAGRLEADGVACRRLHTSHAFHSAMMEPILEPFVELVRGVERRPPEIPFVSNVTGTWITDEQATDPEYWARHLRSTVRFADGAGELLREPGRVLLEVGPGRTLSTLVRRQRSDAEGGEVVTSLPHPRDETPDGEALLGALGRLWLAGAEVDWIAVQPGARRRVPLPTYPFERQRHWIEPPDGAAEGRPRGTAATGKILDVAEWLFVPSWKRATTTAPGGSAGSGSDGESARGPWLLLADASGLADALADRLAERVHGSEIFTVRPGDGFARLEDGGYLVDPRSPGDFASLLEELEARGAPPRRVVHLWAADAAGAAGSGSGVSERLLNEGFHSLVALIRALDRRNARGDLRELSIDLVTRDAQEVTGHEPLSPERAACLGLLKVVPLERPNLACRAIDLASPGAGGGTRDEIEALVGELLSEIEHAEVALRGRYRWVRSFERAAPPAGDRTTPRIREHGVYLITGGLGGIGLEIADWLAETAGARLALVSRGGMPDRAEWDDLLDSEEAPPGVGRRIRQIRRVEEHGGEVLILRADVTDRSQLEGALREAEERFGEIHGLFHVAGAPIERHPIGALTRETAERQLRPKTEGLSTLASVLEGRSPDFCVVASSLSSALGAVEFGAYSAAHAFADAFVARQAAASGFPWVAVNLDNWYTWKDEPADPEADGLVFFMSAAEGREALRHALERATTPQVLVSTGDLTARYAQWVERRSPRSSEDRRAPPPGDADKAPGIRAAGDSPRSDAEKALAGIWSELLGIPEIGIHDDFFELGGDSVIGIQVAARARTAGLELTPKLIFEHPTVAALATACGVSGTVEAEEEPVVGPVPLTPVQRWFFELGLARPEHFNLPVMVELPPPVDSGLLKEAMDLLVEHHDALRLRYVHGDNGVEQGCEPPGGSVPLTIVALDETPEADRAGRVEEEIARAQAGLSLEDGPRMRAVLFDRGPSEPARLLWVVHHLLIDVVSWRLLLDDLGALYGRLVAGEAPELPPKTTSYRTWAGRLREHAGSEELATELEAWTPLAETPPSPLPVDIAGGANTEGSARVVSESLEEAHTEALLREVPSRYRGQIDEVLLAGLLRAFTAWTGESSLLVDMEAHGREPIFDGVDLSRTVGWFTSIFPVRFELEGAATPGEAVRAVKERLRRIPNGGIGYALLRYLSRDPEVRERLSAVPRPGVSFLYLGQFNPSAGAPGRVRWIEADLGASASPENARTHMLQVVAAVRDGRLRLQCIYSENLHDRQTIERLIESWRAELLAMVDGAATSDTGALAPSDFPGARVSQKDLDRLVARIRRAEA